MELLKILELMSAPEKLIDPKQINTLVSYLGGFITDLEAELDDLKIKFSFKWEKVKYETEKPLTDKQTEVKMMRDEVYSELNRVKRRLGELKRYRSDLKSKLDIILSIKRY